MSSTSRTVGCDGAGSSPGAVARSDSDLAVRSDLYANPRSGLDLILGHERGQRLRQVLVDRALQFASAILGARSLFNQPLTRLERHFDIETPAPKARIHMLLEIVDFEIRDRGERFRIERPIRNHMVDAIDELRRKFLPHGHQRDSLKLVRQVFASAADRGRLKAEIRSNFAHHFLRAEITREKYETFFEINDRVVAEPENAPVEHAQQQPRQRRRGLLDLIEQDERESAVIAGDSRKLLLRKHRLRFAMAQISGRRANQFGDLMFHLKFAAIDL